METPRLNELPIEVLKNIFKFLPIQDVQDTRLVCQKFYEASLGTCFFDREWVVFHENRHPFNQANVMQSKRDFLHIRLEYFNPIKLLQFSYDDTLWCHVGPKLKSLCLVQCYITDSDFISVLRRCPKLTCLKISNCRFRMSSSPDEEPRYKDDFRMMRDFCDEDDYFDWVHEMNSVLNAPLQLKLESFSIDDRMDPRLFWRVLKCSPNLRSLSVERFLDPRDDNELSHHFLPLTTEHIFDYIKDRGHQLTNLRLIIDTENSLENPTSEESLAQALFQADNLNLRKLEVNVDLSEEFLLKQKNLEELILSHGASDQLSFIRRELKNLKHLDIGFLYKSVSDVKNILSMKNLDTLRFSYFPCCRDVVDVDACGPEDSSLKSMRMIDTTKTIKVTPGFVSKLARTHKILTHLDLEGCLGVTDASLQSIFEHLVLLESLKLTKCPNLSDAALNGPTLSGGPTYSISRLKKLRTLDLSNCNITGAFFTDEIIFPEIQELCLNFIRVLSRDYVARFIRNNRTLVNLELADSLKFTDDFVGVVVENLWRLRRIYIGGKSGISDRGLELLKKSCRTVVQEEEESIRLMN